jgi:hypothetical protein
MTSPTRDDAPNSAAAPTVPQSRPEPVTRRYRPDTAALDELVQVLYRLLMEAPAEPQGVGTATAELACLSARHE